MKKIVVRKIFKYDPTMSGKYSKYEGYRLIGLQKLDPGVMVGNYEGREKFGMVLNSTLKRGIQSTKYYDADKSMSSGLLNEIQFDLRDLLSESEYLEGGSNLVRKRFVETFLSNGLREKRINIERRIDSLFSQLNSLQDGKHLLISHSFFMKVLQIYLMENSLFKHPEILAKYFDVNEKTYNFGSGFEFNLM
jgi:hypothetical protein